jgi:hypothetical protein
MCSKATQIRLKNFMSRAAAARMLGSMLVLLFGCMPLLGQGSTGQIAGNVSDQSGGNISGSTVAITDVKRGVTKTLVTDDSGEYVAAGLDPGIYKVRIEAKGFKVFERQNILLEVAKEVRIDAVLQPGASSDIITVTEEVPLVDATTATLGGTLNNEVINDLPLNGRNYQNLLTLRPGVMVYPGGGPWTQSTNGIRPEEMSFIVDGLPNDEQFQGTSITNAAVVIGDAATILPIDAIQEFNTQVNPKAEYGWKTGAVTSVGLKSGTNELHGTAYAYGRSDSFDARNYFNATSQAKDPVSLQQWGTTVGGRIIPDKLFFFGGYEQQKYTVGSSAPITVPTTTSLGGDAKHSIPDALAAIHAAGLTPDPASLGLVGCPTTAPYTPCTGIYFGSNSSTSTGENPTYPNTSLSRNALGKVDYHLSDHHSISGSYFFGNDALVGEDTPYTNVAFLTHVHSRAQMVATHWAWTPSSLWANELRFGVTRYTLSITPGDENKPASAYGLFTGVTNPIIGGLPSISVAGFTALGNFFSFPKFVGPDNTFDVVDQVSHFFGKHALKFGGELRDMKVTQATWRRARGQISFNGGNALGGNSTALEDFLLGLPSNAKLLATTPDPVTGSPERHLTQWGYAGFIQDDWRIKPRVTLNMGLRYEYATPPSEAHDLLGNFDPTLGLVQVGKQIPSIYKGDHTNFAPRLGVAWDISGRGTTILRAGGGIAYDLITMNTFLSQQNTNNAPTLGLGVIPTGAAIVTCPNAACGVPIVTPGTGTILTTGLNIPGSSLSWPGTSGGPFIFPGNLSSQVQCGDGITPLPSAANPTPVPDPGPCSILGFDRNYRTPWVGVWNVGIQHAFSSQLSIDVAYVGDHGGKLLGIRDLNQPDPRNNFVQAYGTKFPYLGVINQLSNLYRSNYHGLQNTLTVRNYHGLGLLLGYTYSHALDNMSFNWNQYLPQDSLHPTADYGSSDFDITHRFTASVTYAIPGIKTWGQLLEGWQINSILTLQSGQPWNTYDSTNNISGTGEATDRWDFFGNVSDFTSRATTGIPFYLPGTPPPSDPLGPTDPAFAINNSVCTSKASAASLTSQMMIFGCYQNGKSAMLPPLAGTFGTMGRNIFRDMGFRNLDLSVTKGWRFKERLTVQFRAEMFNVLNHPNFANPWDGTSGYGPAGGFSDPSVPGNFGCGCATPDQAAANPVLGSGGARDIQLGLKLIF